MVFPAVVIDRDALVALCGRLVGRPSPSGGEGDVAAEVGRVMTELGYDEVRVDELGNVVGVMRGRSRGCVVFDGHMDTVGVGRQEAWASDPFTLTERDGSLYGRGIADMKGAIAGMLLGVAALRRAAEELPADVVVSCSVCEEVVEGAALGHVLDRVDARAVVIGESTDLRLNVGQRGRAELLVETTGLPSHSSTPELGRNAVKMMARVIERLSDIEPAHHPVLGVGILEVTDVRSAPYPGLSVVPEYCGATFDRRLLVGEDEASVLAGVERVLKELRAADPTLTVSVRVPESDVVTYPGTPLIARKFAPAWLFPPDHPLVRAGLAALGAAGLPAHLGTYAFCTNGSESAGRRGIPTVGFGPGSEQQAHRIDEHCAVEDLVAAARAYAALAWGLGAAVAR
ncbi:MAG TPA: YgeY family selenium metabolism-linked hydrolase [Thermomicrobiaceae bacterium]|nr:YgeY family selenium metabolism-linked hydrolase [Thermomicrobiaceae bacterium]